MKRIKYLAVLLLTVGVLGLTGCGSSSADVGVQEPTEIADESQAEAETDDENAEGEDAGKNELGEVRIDDLELGTYQMTETAAKEGYILNKTVWTVKVDERGIVTLYNEEGKEVERNQSGVYQIDNEPLHSIRFVKSSSYGDNIFLAGAEFSLNGVSDYGTNTNKTAVSGSDGMVVIEGLEPGNYQLKETCCLADCKASVGCLPA